MEKYVENYFEKLNEFEKNKGIFASLRDKEFAFISTLKESYDNLFESTEPYIYCSPRNCDGAPNFTYKEALSNHENKRKQILEFYSKNCDNADKLYSTLQNQYAELSNAISPLLEYCGFNIRAFGNLLANLVSVVEGKDYSYKKALYDDCDGHENIVYIIASDNISPAEKFSSLEALRKCCIQQNALLLGATLSTNEMAYSVFETKEDDRFLEWQLFVPEKLSYMKDAVSSLINLRIERKDVRVSDETLAIFEDEFFSSMIDQMETNYANVNSSLDDEISRKEESTKLYIEDIKQKKKTKSEQLASFMAKYKPKTEE